LTSSSASLSRPSIVERFDALLRANPDAAVTLDDHGACSRAQMKDRSRAVARVLAESALAHGTPVVFMARNGPDFLAGLLALWRDGLVPVLGSRQPCTHRSC
jgi:acyl-CoA synthetase (AMP-forming)/AMP-acid ligase II